MKEAVGGVSLFTIVIVFVVLFTGYISLSINYSKAYNVKNELINIIRNQGGVCTSQTPNLTNNCYNFVEQITDYFRETNYRSYGNCGEGFVGYTRTGELAGTGDRTAFCIKGIPANGNSELPNALYYQVKVFWQLDLPIFSRLFNFTISGETARVYAPNECVDATINYDWCS
ncbi:MAG: hypothetical protein HFI49_03110 [Bacilli bacterium]|nr:hypothetical protein [Bacilli bacterium]